VLKLNIGSRFWWYS